MKLQASLYLAFKTCVKNTRYSLKAKHPGCSFGSTIYIKMENTMYIGGCECKFVRYQFSGEPLTCYACHCTDCQTSSGSAFGLSMILNDNDIQIIEGEVAVITIDVNGTKVLRHHCASCGTSFWFSAEEYPGLIALKPGTFDDTSWFKPIAHLWMRSAQPWLQLDKTATKYQKQPDMSVLLELWANRKSI